MRRTQVEGASCDSRDVAWPSKPTVPAGRLTTAPELIPCHLPLVTACKNQIKQKKGDKLLSNDMERAEGRFRSEASAPFVPPSDAPDLLMHPPQWAAISNDFGRLEGDFDLERKPSPRTDCVRVRRGVAPSEGV